MKTRILRGGKPAITVHWADDYSEPMAVAYVSIEQDGDEECMLLRWKVTGKADTAAAYQAIKCKDLNKLMDVLDRYEPQLPRVIEQLEADEAELSL